MIETGIGNCHVYVDAAADLDMALAITLNAKVSRPSVCNAAETLLVHRAAAEHSSRGSCRPARARSRPSTATSPSAAQDPRAVAATDEDWAAEYLSLDIAVRVVDDARRRGRPHPAMVAAGTPRRSSATLEPRAGFVARLDSAAVMVNASTRFTDGAEFGFGAEIGISTQKLHARGPMGLPELTIDDLRRHRRRPGALTARRNRSEKSCENRVITARLRRVLSARGESGEHRAGGGVSRPWGYCEARPGWRLCPLASD